jgi:flavin-dependent dehydrogenase
MRSAEIIIVGGGPAGSAAAHSLKQAGADVLLLDKARFPRLKLCAGWITPEVISDLQLDIEAYPHRFLSFRRLHWHLKGLRVPVPCVQHSIRRFEFDAWLLERSGAEVLEHTVRSVRREGEEYVLDEALRCRYLIGAGGTSCPVYRALFRDRQPRVRELQTVTLELEFPCEWRDPDCHLWFFEQGLPGYSWYVPKARGWLNVGVGGMASRIKQRGEDIRLHWQHLARVLKRRFDIVPPEEPTGYSYFLRGPLRLGRIDNAFLTGDAAGLATRDLCEGIGPAIRSGQRAADSILTGAEYRLEGLTGASLGGGLITRWMDWAFTRGVSQTDAPAVGASA